MFIISKGDVSSVSLREIRRFANVYNYFFETYLEKYIKIKLIPKEKEIKALALSIYICYYLRLPTPDLRKTFIDEIIKDSIPLLEICVKESQFITEKVLEGKTGFAKNKGLCENIFSEFICVMIKEPLIICGKPGSSKSLSVRLLLNAMRGEKSNIEFFKQFPEIISSFYQCSLTSTSENLEKVFNDAQNILYQKKDIISLIFMDEMGIADESENNPLKFLHSKFDDNSYEIKDNKSIAFIGISNWTLDASKMNRAINIVVDEPDLNYIEQTAKEIVSNINVNLGIKWKNIIKIICKTYIDYIKEQERINKNDFHGLRDFYFLIKNIFFDIQENEENIDNFMKYMIKSIYRNFGGYENSAKIFISIFLKNYKYNLLSKENNIFNLINDNIESQIDSRYLLLIVKNEEIVENILKNMLKEKEYEIISDKNINKNDNESNEVLNLLLKIEFLMKKEITLIIKNLEILYPSLYELFNKNFYEYNKSGNKFVQISYENSHSLTQVNKNFRLIVIVREDKLNEEEKPFLSRFEKQIFSVENILNKEEKEYADKLYNYILKINKNIEFSNLENSSIDFLYYLMIKNKQKLKKNVINFLEELVPLFSQEMIYFLNNDEEKENNLDYQTKKAINLIYNEYYEKNYNLKSFLSNIISKKNVIYTCSDVNLISLNKNKQIEVNYFKKKVKYDKFIILEITKTIIEEKKNIQFFLGEKNYDLYFIEINEETILNNYENIYFKKLIYELEQFFNGTGKIIIAQIFIQLLT